MGINKYTSYCVAILSVFSLLSLVYIDPVVGDSISSSENYPARPQDLRNLSKEDIQKFFGSFDTVICDLDDTVWKHGSPIHGAIKNVNKLRECGKKILFVTNNSVFPKEKFIRNLMAMGYHATPDEIITPSETLIWYLKQIKFDGFAFVIGSKYFYQTLQDNDIPTITGPILLAERVGDMIEMFQHLEHEVKAVIVEFDVNVNYGKLIEAVAYLQQSDVLFLTGSMDKKLALTPNITLIGNSHFVDLLSEHTGRTPMGYAKPGLILKDYVTQNFVTGDPKKTLFIGDSLRTDMKFAEMCGFQRLWVRSGRDSATPCENGCEGTPQYQLPDLGQLAQCEI